MLTRNLLPFSLNHPQNKKFTTKATNYSTHFDCATTQIIIRRNNKQIIYLKKHIPTSKNSFCIVRILNHTNVDLYFYLRIVSIFYMNLYV